MYRREWLVLEEGGKRKVPAFDWLVDLPLNIRTQLLGIVTAVQTTGPDRWFDSNTHTAMQGDLEHVHEARDRHDQTLYRLYLRWHRDEQRVVVLDGRSKANSTTITEEEYAKVAELGHLADKGPSRFATADDFAVARLERE
jgi:hypothetical protein